MQNAGLDELQVRNQDVWEKYQQSHICRGKHANGRKWRVSKEPLEGERGAKVDLKLNVRKQNKIKQNWDHGICSHNFMANKRKKKKWKKWRIFFSGAPKLLQMVTAGMKFSQLFHSPLLLSSRDSLVLCFLPRGGVICISEVTDISPGNLDSILCFIQPSTLQFSHWECLVWGGLILVWKAMTNLDSIL